MVGSAMWSLYDSTIGKKCIMATTGCVLFGFVFVHMLGNLKFFLGAEAINHYAIGLRELGSPILGHEQALWLARIVLLVSLVLHLVAAFQLTRIDLAARPNRYAMRRPTQETFAARTMRWGGVIILLFVIYHILHLTLGRGGTPFVDGDVYYNMYFGFSNPIVSAVYIVAMIALALHLRHGVWSMCQTLGLRTERTDGLIRGGATAFALIIAIGNISIPLTILIWGGR